MSSATKPADFIKPMECCIAAKVPTGSRWTYELKFDGYRMESVHQVGGQVILYSRNKKELSYPQIASALSYLPAGTILDGELTAVDHQGCPRFNLLQNYQTTRAHLVYFVFDILMHAGRDLRRVPLSERRSLLRKVIRPCNHVNVSVWANSSEDMMRFVREHKLEGIVAKRSKSLYEPGKRSDSWVKTRIPRSQKFVVGGYTPSYLGIDALIVGFYSGRNLLYAGRVRAGFNPYLRRTVLESLKDFATNQCPFSNLPDEKAGTWGQGLTAENMRHCRWLKPEGVAEIDFAEWTPGDRLRHASFRSLLSGENLKKVFKET